MEKLRGCGALLTFYVSRGQASSVHQAKAAERGDGKGTSEGRGSQTIEGLAAKRVAANRIHNDRQGKKKEKR